MWMNLDYIILSEISQTPEDKCCMILLICEIKKIELTEVESKLVASRLWVGKMVRRWSKGASLQL